MVSALLARDFQSPDPSGSGVAGKLRGNYGIFGTVEQMLYRAPSDTEKRVSAREKGITIFARAAYSPPDRNLIDFYADGGVGFNGMIAARPLDRWGVGFAYLHISGAAQQLDDDTQFFTGIPSPIRSAEMLLEVIYEAHVKPGWLLQPYFQYVFRPAGGVPNPSDPTGLSRIGVWIDDNAKVLVQLSQSRHGTCGHVRYWHIYCFVSAVTTVLLFIAASSHFRVTRTLK